MDLNPDSGIAVFTDGSAYTGDGSGGWAWVAIDAYTGNQADSGSAWDTTSNRMELTAAIEGLTSIFTQYGSCDVLVYSDSQYMVLGNQDPYRARNVNKDLWSRMDEAITHHTFVEWNHVKGHSGQLYNELVDQMAGSARKKLIEKGKDASNNE